MVLFINAVCFGDQELFGKKDLNMPLFNINPTH